MGCIYTKPLIEDRFVPEKYLHDITLDSTIPYFPPITCGKVVKVYDGDTIYIASDEIKCPMPNKTFRFAIRIKHIDTPEIRTKNAEEKALAKKAKHAMEELVLNKYVTLEEVEHESKWGRILAVVKVNGVTISDVMLEMGHAKPYEGGHKENW
jgi:micrococcal nuclease